MRFIKRLDIVRNKTEEISMFDSEVTRWLDENGHETSDIMKVKADVPNNKHVHEEEARVHGDVMHYTNTGLVFSQKIYNVFMATSSDNRKATTTWVKKEIIPQIGEWALCGLKAKDIFLAVNKFMAYMGLLASASKRFSELFGQEISIRRVAVVGDHDVMVEGLTSFVANERKISKAEARKLIINAFDGMGVIMAELTNGESMTIRAPWVKAFVQAVYRKALKKWLKDHGIPTKFKDRWGKEWDLDDVDIILTESCFKAAKLYESWEYYCNAFERLNHHICVCVREHKPKLKGMPYQQGQTLLGTECDADMFACHAKDTVRKYSDPAEAANLLPKWQKRAVKMYPAMLNERHTARTIQEKYTSLILDMMGGRIPELGYNSFAAADITALIQFIFGQPVTGTLKAGECFCHAAEPGLVDVTRNPHMDHAHVLLKRVDSLPLAIGPSMFINIWDLATIKLRCDYDGDHFWWSQDERLIDLVQRTYEKLGDVTFDWSAPAAKKVLVTKKEISNFVSNLLHGSEIGLYADALTKMWNHQYDFDICGWLTYGANVIIDAAKHGEVDKKVLDILKDILKEMSELKLPWFAMYAKADKEHPINDPYWIGGKKIIRNDDGSTYERTYEPRVEHTNSFLDMFSEKVDKIIPKTLVIDGADKMIFDTHVLLIKPDRKMGRLSNISIKAREYDPETGEYTDGGKWQQICFRLASEYKALCDADDSFKGNHDEWMEFKRQYVIRELIQWARDQYSDLPDMDKVSDDRLLDAIYDIITRNIFNTFKTTDAYDMVVKNTYWWVFGEKTCEVIRTNLGISEDDLDIPDDDMDDEDDNDVNAIWG